MEQSENKDLKYNDSILSFQFWPQPNGIYFQVENLTANNIFLIWDKTYFIGPNGNSFKALNTDILETQDKLVDKENYESIIPSNSKFLRFTTPNPNISIMEYQYTRILYSEIFNSININDSYHKFFQGNPYWMLTSSFKGTKDMAEPDAMARQKVIDFMRNSDNLGIGFTFRMGDEYIEYHFKLKVSQVDIYRKSNAGNEIINFYIKSVERSSWSGE
ncbi:MAG: hypothetical protein JRJ57_08405 [Deltaproteobacteria bacterium]|nr:hypothetical protein [Deltaproteobacteria bacterium]